MKTKPFFLFENFITAVFLHTSHPGKYFAIFIVRAVGGDIICANDRARIIRGIGVLHAIKMLVIIMVSIHTAMNATLIVVQDLSKINT